MSHQTGLNLTQVQVISTNTITNRLGTSEVLEILLTDPTDPEDEWSNLTIGFVAKQVHEGVDPSQVEQTNASFVSWVEDRSNVWGSVKKKLSDSAAFEFESAIFPDQLFAPEVVATEDGCVRYSTLNRFVGREKSGLSRDMQFAIFGYALARFHNHKYSKVDPTQYKRLFTFLQTSVEKPVLRDWAEVLETAEGGSSYIIGDCGFNNVQYNALRPGTGQLDSLTFVDPVFVPNADRCEDLGSALAQLVWVYLTGHLRANPNASLRDTLTKTFRFLVLEAGQKVVGTYLKVCPDLAHQYSQPPLDFFLGAELLQRSSTVDPSNPLLAPLKDLLFVLGTQILTEHPLTHLFAVDV